MTPDKYASRVWEEVTSQFIRGNYAESVAIISAALKRQREACARGAAKHYVNQPMDYAIRNAEVDAPTDSEVKE